MQEQDRSDTCFYVSPALKCKFVFRTSHSSRVFEGIPVAPFPAQCLETILCLNALSLMLGSN